MQGERVRVLVDGIGSIDVSNTSADHAPAVNPLLADRIEVLRGPQALLYGSAAIGGVVNVIDRRIPTSVPEEPVHVGLATYGSAANQRSIAGSVEVPLGGGWVAHADGSRSVSDDMKIGGYALTPALRAQARATAAAGTGDPGIDYAANADVQAACPTPPPKAGMRAGSCLYRQQGQHRRGLQPYRQPVWRAHPLCHAAWRRAGSAAHPAQPGPLGCARRIRPPAARSRRFRRVSAMPPIAMPNWRPMAAWAPLLQPRHGRPAGSDAGPAGRLARGQRAQIVSRDFDVHGDEAFLPRTPPARSACSPCSKCNWAR
jgi:iron complex outermembrane receptor protein